MRASIKAKLAVQEAWLVKKKAEVKAVTKKVEGKRSAKLAARVRKIEQ